MTLKIILRLLAPIWVRATKHRDERKKRKSGMKFFLEIVISGILSGLMYSLVALGFVLIFKASGVLNFAQGAMVYSAALAVVSFIDQGLPMWLAVIAAFAFMVIVGICTEKFVLGKLVNQPPITLFMATIGLSFFLDGL